MGDFQNYLISPVFDAFFKRFFAQNSFKLLVEARDFEVFFWILILTQCDDFAKAWWAIFITVLFLQYLVFFSSGILYKATLNDLYRMNFDMFFWILVFH